MPNPWANALPPDTRAVGSGNPPLDVDGLVDAVTAMGAGVNVQNPAFAGGADPAGAATSTLAFNAAIAAIPATGGYVYVPPGTYKIGSAPSALTTGQYVICAPGVIFNFTGTGDCFRWVDATTYTTRTIQGGGILGRPIIDGSGDGAGSSALHAGDILGFRFDVAVQNFSKAGDIGIHLDNQNFWTEQAIGIAYINNCSQSVVFDCGGAATSTGSYDRGDFTFYLSAKTFTGDVVTFANGAQLLGGRLRLFGNINSSSSAFSHAVLALTGATPGGHSPATNSSLVQCELTVNVESDLGLANTYQTINFGSTSNVILDCTGNLSFGAGNQFAQSNVTTIATQFAYLGQIVGDSVLGIQTIDNRLSVGGQTFLHGSMFIGDVAAPTTPSGGGVLYVDASDDLRYLGSGTTNTLLARHAAPVNAASASLKPSNPAGTTSNTIIMMGLGSTCTFTPKTTGKVRVTMNGIWYTSGAQVDGNLGGRFGTGTAPVNGAADAGTRWGTGATDQPMKAASSGFGIPWSITEILSLTPGTAYWFDVGERVTATGTTVTANIVCSLDELAA